MIILTYSAIVGGVCEEKERGPPLLPPLDLPKHVQWLRRIELKIPTPGNRSICADGVHGEIDGGPAD